MVAFIFKANEADFKERLIANVKKEVKQIMEERYLSVGICYSLNLKDTAPFVLLVLLTFNSYLFLPS